MCGFYEGVVGCKLSSRQRRKKRNTGWVKFCDRILQKTQYNQSGKRRGCGGGEDLSWSRRSARVQNFVIKAKREMEKARGRMGRRRQIGGPPISAASADTLTPQREVKKKRGKGGGKMTAPSTTESKLRNVRRS